MPSPDEIRRLCQTTLQQLQALSLARANLLFHIRKAAAIHDHERETERVQRLRRVLSEFSLRFVLDKGRAWRRMRALCHYATAHNLSGTHVARAFLIKHGPREVDLELALPSDDWEKELPGVLAFLTELMDKLPAAMQGDEMAFHKFIMQALRKRGERMTGDDLLCAAGFNPGGGNRSKLSKMVKAGIITGGGKGRKTGYGLPEWQHRSSPPV